METTAVLRTGGRRRRVLRAGGEEDKVAHVKGKLLVTTTERLASRRGRKKRPEARWSSEIGASIASFLLRPKKITRALDCAQKAGEGNEAKWK